LSARSEQLLLTGRSGSFICLDQAARSGAVVISQPKQNRAA